MNVLVVLGGQSAEHEISIISARKVLESITPQYTTVLVGISKNGEWFHLTKDNLASMNVVAEASLSPCQLIRKNSKVHLQLENKDLFELDVAIPVLHGPFGEDGSIQGMFEVLGLPYVGSRILSSSLCMDKISMKKMLISAQIPTADFISIDRHNPAPDFDTVANKLSTPFFIKPSNMGSSVGVHKVRNQAEYATAIKDAAKFDSRIIIETNIEGREFEVAIYDNGAEIRVSAVGEIICNHDFYSYDSKYLDPNGAIVNIPAEIDPATSEKMQAMAKSVFELLDCRHLARIDFFIGKNQQIYVNEPNTFPGCNPISLFPQLWDADGVSMKEMFSAFIEDAVRVR